MKKKKFKAVVVGVSAGGTKALKTILPRLPENFPVPVIIVQHISPDSDSYFIRHLDSLCRLKVREAAEKEKAVQGNIYFAPPNYHLLLEEDGSFSLSLDARVNFARPSIDVLFETAAYAFCPHLIGVILTGANQDGARGLKAIADAGGYTLVQDPATAEVDSMPRAALGMAKANKVLSLDKIAAELMHVVGR